MKYLSSFGTSNDKTQVLTQVLPIKKLAQVGVNVLNREVITLKKSLEKLQFSVEGKIGGADTISSENGRSN